MLVKNKTIAQYQCNKIEVIQIPDRDGDNREMGKILCDNMQGFGKQSFENPRKFYDNFPEANKVHSFQLAEFTA